MEVVLRALVMYSFLMVIFRISGQRTLAQITPFDFVLLLIVGEATQQALLGEDFSITNSLVVISTLITIDVVLSQFKQRFNRLGAAVEGMPLLIVENGEIIDERADKARIDEQDILQAARQTQGIERLHQVKYAVLERCGGISVIPKQEGQ